MILVEDQVNCLLRNLKIDENFSQHSKNELIQRISEKGSLKIKAGFDPTSPDLHLGHAVLLNKLRQFQDFGHQVFFVIGDFTATIGDPTGRNKLRPPLSKDEVVENSKTYLDQALRILDPSKTTTVFNSSWLEKLSMNDCIDLLSKFTLSQVLERNDFQNRFNSSQSIHLHELMYPLMQGFDSVRINPDIEIGGSDQLFNLNVGRDLMRSFGLIPQIVLTTPILEGTNAKNRPGIIDEKMSKSLNNYIGLTEDPIDMFNKIMLISDSAISKFINLLDDISLYNDLNVVEGKKKFAHRMVAKFHDKKIADFALEQRDLVGSGFVPNNIEEKVVECEGDAIPIGKALMLAGLSKSSSEGMRMIKSGSVYINGEKFLNERFSLRKFDKILVKIGNKNKKFNYITVV